MKFIFKVLVLAGLILVARLEKEKTFAGVVNSLNVENPLFKSTASHSGVKHGTESIQKIAVSYKN